MPHLRRPRYADVTATLALIIAMGGTAYGVATTAAPSSVNTAAIQNKAVTAPKLAGESVTASKLAPGSVTAAAVGKGSLKLSDLRGISESGAINFTLSPHGCGTIDLGISGGVPGSTAILSYTGAFLKNVVFGPVTVRSAKLAQATACSFTGKTVKAVNINVRLTTLN